MGYTPFAKKVKKMMDDTDENLADLAKLLDCSVSFVSLVFKGQKMAPVLWIEIISNHYNLDSIQRMELFEAYCKSNKNASLNDSQKELLFLIEEDQIGLTDEEFKELSKIVDEKS